MSTADAIAIIDYGAGNLRSVVHAVVHAGLNAIVTDDASVIRRAPGVILPGVGAAADTMENLVSRNLTGVIGEVISAGKPFLGVCMGMQALFTVSEEGGSHACLDILGGTVRRFAPGLSIPHMGWNQVRQVRSHPIFDGIADGTHFYFVHSFHVDATDPKIVIGDTTYGPTFPSVIASGSLVATQFHPEKSATGGLRLYANFGRIVRGELGHGTVRQADTVGAA
ncbi:MAG: imidazole glycerol phosphate synthase subunit HisH [Chloroflexi bacterium]|nr:imidazole glycerol phosphate synthase subunit HisH [Chloroflexota bacterium]